MLLVLLLLCVVGCFVLLTACSCCVVYVALWELFCCVVVAFDVVIGVCALFVLCFVMFVCMCLLW